MEPVVILITSAPCAKEIKRKIAHDELNNHHLKMVG